VAEDAQGPGDDAEVDVRGRRDLFDVSDAVDVGGHLLHGQVPRLAAGVPGGPSSALVAAEVEEVSRSRQEHGHLPVPRVVGRGGVLVV